MVDLHLDYGLRLMGDARLVGIVDVFNVFNLNTVTNYDSNSETTFGVLNPDFGQPVDPLTRLPAFQAPRQIRIGARFEF